MQHYASMLYIYIYIQLGWWHANILRAELSAADTPFRRSSSLPTHLLIYHAHILESRNIILLVLVVLISRNTTPIRFTAFLKQNVIQRTTNDYDII